MLPIQGSPQPARRYSLMSRAMAWRRSIRTAGSGMIFGSSSGASCPRPWWGPVGVEVPRIADIGFAWAAWIIDPATNALGILQTKGVTE